MASHKTQLYRNQVIFAMELPAGMTTNRLIGRNSPPGMTSARAG